MKYRNECFNELINLIENNPNNWQYILMQKPYSLKSIKQCFYNHNWFMLVYNLFESKLTDPIVKACRGTVVDISNPNDVKIVCAPYLKFCNLGEFPEEDKKIDWNSVWISEKIDGILIKAFKYNDKFYWTTNGSFDLNAPLMDKSDKYVEHETDYCKTFFDILDYAINKIGKCKKEYIDEDGYKTIVTSEGWCNNFMNGDTLCLELVSPKNKIICDYPETELYWHGFRRNDLTEFKAIDLIEAINFNNNYEHMNIKVPKIFDLNKPSAEAIKVITDSFDGSEEEGVVICDKNWNRAKIKSKSYLKYKFLKGTNDMSDKKIFKYILLEEIDDMINDTNRERINNVKNEILEYRKYFNKLRNTTLLINTKFNYDRKLFAKRVRELYGNLNFLAFRIIDGMPFEVIIKRAYIDNYKKFKDDLEKIKVLVSSLEEDE